MLARGDTTFLEVDALGVQIPDIKTASMILHENMV
jgi:hypothetical protein